MKKNDKVIGICQGYTKEGLGVVKIDGYPFFVKNILKGERAKLIITKMNKSYGYAKVDQLLEKSLQRQEPFCPVAKQCGGCQLQHMSYTEQLAFKQQKVQDVIDRIAKIDSKVDNVKGMEYPLYYRNKCQMPVGLQEGKVVTGFYRVHSNVIIDTDSCQIQSKRINEVLTVMKKLLYKYGNAEVFRHLLIKHAFSTDEVMVVWIVRNYPFKAMKEMAEELSSSLSFVKSIVVNINQRTDNVILGDKEIVLWGEAKIMDKIHDLAFHISSKSFYQVNPVQTSVLYDTALTYAQLTGNELVLDLYCGVGTISMFLAQKARKVIGIEVIEQAVQDAKENAKLNQLDNVEFICSDAASYASKLCEEEIKPDVIVVDPPRKGLDAVTLESIVKMQPNRIVYVSCDPATLARDLAMLNNCDYKTLKVTPVDMFPYTPHVESVCLMSKVR